MSGLMYAQMGLSAISGLAGLGVAKEQAKMDAAIQAYNNTISAVSAAQSLNVTELNELQVQDAATRADAELQRQALIAQDQAAVASAAAGVEGGSTEAVMRGLRSSVSQAHFAQTEQARAQFRAFGQERRNINVAKVTNKDVTVIPKPSAASTLLGLGTNMLKIWDSHQAPGDTIADRLQPNQE